MLVGPAHGVEMGRADDYWLDFEKSLVGYIMFISSKLCFVSYLTLGLLGEAPFRVRGGTSEPVPC